MKIKGVAKVRHALFYFFQKIKNMNSGIYFLLIRNNKGHSLKIKNKDYFFPRGFYVYVGSAQKNLCQRIERHRRKEKKKRWHIDYLLEFAKIIEVKIITNQQKAKEQFYAEKWIEVADFIPVPKFGASDSKAKTHLIGFKTKKQIINNNLWKQSKNYEK